MQVQANNNGIDARPSTNIRYQEQQFYSIVEQYEVVEPKVDSPPAGSLIKESTLQSNLRSAFEHKYRQQKQINQEKFLSLPEDVRKFCLLDQDTGKIFDTRNPEQMREIQELLASNLCTNDTIHKDSAWNEFIKLSLKMNEHLLDYAELGDIDSIKNLLESRTEFYLDIDTKGLDDWTPLHMAANEGYVDIIHLLLDHAANIEASTKLGRTPLMIAVQQNQTECAKALLQRGAKISAQDKDLNTALHMASYQGNVKMIELLLESKADPSVRNLLSQTPMAVCSDAKSHLVYEKYGIHYETSSYDRTVVPGTDFLLKNSRYDHVSRAIQRPLINKQPSKEQEGQAKELAREPSKKQSKFINLVKFISIKMDKDDAQEKLSPNQFNFYQLLGKGAFGEVYLVDKQGQVPQKLYAMKILKKDRMMSQNLLKYVQTEKDVLSFMHHPFIVKLNFAFQTESKLFLVMDYCPGGDLSKLLDVRRRLTEDEARIYVAEILLAIESLHKNNIIFRDLKPENVVIDAEGHAMLTDFGLSKKGQHDGVMSKSFCGSPAYLPPEILSRQGHNRMVDWYLLGVMTYELLGGIPPYYANDREVLFENIRRGPLKIPKFWSAEAKDFIVSLLNRDPSRRMGFERDGEEIREHPWLAKINWDDCYNRRLKPAKPQEPQLNKVPLKINFQDNEESRNKVNGWTFYEEQ